jgi:hypothetical protein
VPDSEAVDAVHPLEENLAKALAHIHRHTQGGAW